jgi:hypothetical protein
MLRSHLTRLLVTAAAALSLSAVLAAGALAATPYPTQGTSASYYNAPPGACYLPSSGTESITAPGITYTNPWGDAVVARQFAILVSTTGAWMNVHWLGDRVVAAGSSTTFPQDTFSAFRSLSNYFYAKTLIRTEVYYKSSTPFQVWTGTPVSYRKWSNSPFYGNGMYDTGINLTSC